MRCGAYIVVGCLGCATQMLETNLHKLHIYDFFKVEVLQRTAVLGSGYILCIPLGLHFWLICAKGLFSSNYCTVCIMIIIIGHLGLPSSS